MPRRAPRAALVTQASSDLDSTGSLPGDTYFGGKGLARLGALLSLARALGDADLATRAADRLADEIAPWTAATGCTTRAQKCFVYDDRLHLVVGKTVGFGAEDGNDHHFHYGYFLAAAAALAQARPDLVDTLRPVMNALAADIAAGSADTLSAVRVFDPYRGHSWAAGLAPFADGNNQESSSEAVAAWNGLALWAQVSGDDALYARAVWLLSSEADAARTLYLEPAPGTRTRSSRSTGARNATTTPGSAPNRRRSSASKPSPSAPSHSNTSPATPPASPRT